MKNFSLCILLSVFIFVGCSEKENYIVEESVSNTLIDSSFLRLNFEDESALEDAIMAGGMPDALMLKTANNRVFINMLSRMSVIKGSSVDAISYYEGLGFDTLVPNLNFAALLTPDGELEIGSEVIRITPAGTYRFKKEHEDEFHRFLKHNPNFTLVNTEDDIHIISDNILLYNTFKNNTDEYELVYEGELEPLNEYEDDEAVSYTQYSQLKSSSSPDFKSFTSFRADRKTWAGGIMQNLIGSKRDHTMEFNKKRRLRGTFYFYNYGVYAETGVTGQTQKKNWVGWSGTDCHEIRVGWQNVKIEKKIDDYYMDAMRDLSAMYYYEPQDILIDGRWTKVATLLVHPDFEASVKNRLLTKGVKESMAWLKKEFHDKYLSNQNKEFIEAEALIVATRTDASFYSSRDVIKYNTDRYTHVFNKSWMDFVVGYNSQTGFFINNVNSGNAAKAATYLKAVADAFNSHRGTLKHGEVYICARFYNTWRGMKIVKDEEK